MNQFSYGQTLLFYKDDIKKIEVKEKIKIILEQDGSNSYIENYNRHIKLKLSKYLFGKFKTKISWPFFIFFKRNEEEEYRLENIKFGNSIEMKNINLNNTKKPSINIENSEKSEINIKRKLL